MDKNNKVLTVVITALATLLICISGALTYKILVLDKDVKTNNEEDKNEVKAVSEVICKKTLDTDSNYTYELYRDGIYLITTVKRETASIVKQKTPYFDNRIILAKEKTEICNNISMNMTNINAEDNFDYKLIQLKDESSTIFQIVAYGIQKDNLYRTLDLTSYTKSVFADTLTGEKVENIRVKGNKLYAIKCAGYNDGSIYEDEYVFEYGKYTMETTNTPEYVDVAGKKC